MVVLRTTEPYPLATEKPTIKQKIKIEITIKNETAMKKFNDKATRIIMNNGNSMEIKYKSELLEQIRQDFEIMENESSDIDPGFFTEDDVWSLYEFLLMRMKKRRSIFMKKNILITMITERVCEYEGAV